jgi:hypothetical protein
MSRTRQTTPCTPNASARIPFAVPLPVEKLDCGLDELMVMLEDAAVPGVGVDDELDVRQATAEVDRVLGGHHPVVIAVGDQRGLPYDGQVRGRLEPPSGGCP